MVRRPSDWNDMTQEQKMKWLRDQRTKPSTGRKVKLTEKDAPRVWRLMKKHDNLSIVAELVGVSRPTLYRFLDAHPRPKGFVVQDDMNLEDFPEIQFWLQRQAGFAKQNTISGYLTNLRAFFKWMKRYHPERAKPALWTSDDVLEHLYGNEAIGWKGLESYQWHTAIVPLRQLGLKAQTEFPHIDVGLLPTKKTHKAKRSLAGSANYYYSRRQVDEMIQSVTTKKAKALIAFLYNTAARVEAVTNTRVEDLDVEKHMVKMVDKGDVHWLVYGLTDKTLRLLEEYLEARGYPKSGWLFPNGNDNKMTEGQINDVIKEAGMRASIKDKELTSKAFRKSFVKNAVECEINPLCLIGTGKGTPEHPKTAMCVGWSSDIVFKHYAPQLLERIEEGRQKFSF